jgi:hypothetical protein
MDERLARTLNGERNVDARHCPATDEAVFTLV